MLPLDEDNEPLFLRRKDIRRDKFRKEKENASLKRTKKHNALRKRAERRDESLGYEDTDQPNVQTNGEKDKS